MGLLALAFVVFLIWPQPISFLLCLGSLIYALTEPDKPQEDE